MQKVLFNAHYSETIESVLTHMVLLTSLQFLSVFLSRRLLATANGSRVSIRVTKCLGGHGAQATL